VLPGPVNFAYLPGRGEPHRPVHVKSSVLPFSELLIMRRSFAIAVTACALFSGIAQAQTVVATSNIVVRALDRSINFTSDTTTSLRDMKAVVQARDDAASFVASAGEIRGAQLEAALQTIRQQLPEAQAASDLQLAEAILAL